MTQPFQMLEEKETLAGVQVKSMVAETVEQTVQNLYMPRDRVSTNEYIIHVEKNFISG
jgi:hypothetical protein